MPSLTGQGPGGGNRLSRHVLEPIEEVVNQRVLFSNDSKTNQFTLQMPGMRNSFWHESKDAPRQE